MYDAGQNKRIHEGSKFNPKAFCGSKQGNFNDTDEEFWSLSKKNIRMAFPAPNRQYE
jgi:hypothetical protein